MLRIYICYQCGTTRIVSNNHDSSCLSCNKPMLQAPISYEKYVNLNREERESLIIQWLNELPSN
ncbi:MAG: hypothetical protein ACERKZ_10275 [Lachnotalea sp.]